MNLSKELKSTRAPSIIKKLMLDQKIDPQEKEYILALAILMIKNTITLNETDGREECFKLAQFIITKYSITYDDYTPLYDFATTIGDYPISKFILQTINHNTPKSIHQIFADIALFEFQKTAIDNRPIVQTYHQKSSTEALLKDTQRYQAYIAPTSYGKSEFIIDYINAKKIQQGSKIVYIAPTNLLVDQTAAMIRKTLRAPQYKMILHYDTFNPEKDASQTLIAVFTQERGIEFLLKYKKLFFNYVIIDEAHELFANNERSRLLQLFIEKNEHLNDACSVLFLSPVVAKSNNFIPKNKTNEKVIFSQKIERSMKIPIFSHYNYKERSSIKYNQFLKEAYTLEIKYKDEFDYIKHHSTKQNLLFLSSPRDIETATQSFTEKLETVNSKEIDTLVAIVSQKIHKDFYMVESIKTGVIYLHGKLPDSIREYLVEKLKSIPTIKYLIANTVVLSGLNIPIDSVFLLKLAKMNNNSLINLIGRVNRLSHIFEPSDKENIKKLLCHVHFVSTEKYDSQQKLKAKMENSAPQKIEDQVDNLLLKKEPSKENKDYENYQKCYKKRAILNEYRGIENPQSITETEVEQLLYVCGLERVLYKTISKDLLKKIKTSIHEVQASHHPNTDLYKRIFDAIYTIFFSHCSDDGTKFGEYNIARLKNTDTRNFYIYFLKNQKNPMHEKILKLVKYWKEKIRHKNQIIYFGREYGEISKATSNYPNNKKVYIDLKTKSEAALINLAIVKIYMEEDFVGFELHKFFKFLNLADVLSDNELNVLKYAGMTNKHGIALINHGIDPSIIYQLEKANQLKNLSIKDEQITYNTEFLDYYKKLDDFDQFWFKKYIPMDYKPSIS